MSKRLAIIQPSAIEALDALNASDNPIVVYLTALPSPHSRRAMQLGIKTLYDTMDIPLMQRAGFPLWTLGYQHVQAIKSRLIEQGKSAAVINRSLCAVRGVYKDAWRLGLIEAESYQRIADIPNYRETKASQASGRALSIAEMKALIADCLGDESAIGYRDAAIIVLGVRGGLRRAEIAKLLLGDYDAIKGMLTVHGKGNKERTVYLANRPRQIFERWLAVRGSAPGKVFLPVLKSGEINFQGKFTDQTVYDVLVKRVGTADIEPFSPHDMRRTFIGDALDEGIDLATVSEIAGHSSPATTKRYDRRGERAKESAAHKLDFPF